jgi:hypothetical protein
MAGCSASPARPHGGGRARCFPFRIAGRRSACGRIARLADVREFVGENIVAQRARHHRHVLAGLKGERAHPHQAERRVAIRVQADAAEIEPERGFHTPPRAALQRLRTPG